MKNVSWLFGVMMVFWGYGSTPLSAQGEIPVITELDLDAAPAGQISKYYLYLVDNGLAQPVCVPVMVAKGREAGPVLGLTAAIHGDELNGIPIIQAVFKELDLDRLRGTVVGVPGLNVISLNLDRRLFLDEKDLNRVFPGKANGDRSEQYVFQVFAKIIRHFDYQIDMHTASFGRVNSFYVRADMADDTLAQLAHLQEADIILDNRGTPSAGTSGGARTLRAEAVLNGIPTITVEYGNPQIYQSDLTSRGVQGIFRTLNWLGMISNEPPPRRAQETVICKKSYWIYTTQGGLLEVPVALNQKVQKDEVIGVLKNAFGDVVATYYAPEAGIVIGKSTNPVNMSGGRIIHLGVLR